MDRMKLAREFSEALVERYGVHIKSVVLFGSVASGRDNDESDIDLLVLVDDRAVDKDIDNLIADFVLRYGELPTPLVYLEKDYNQKKNFSFQKTIQQTGVVLYGG